MSATALSSDLRAYAVKRWPTANHKFRKARLADLLGFTERRVRSFWEATAAAPRNEEIGAITALIGRKEEADAHSHADRALAERLAELEAQVAVLVEALAREKLASQGRASSRAVRSNPRKGAGAAHGSEAHPG